MPRSIRLIIVMLMCASSTSTFAQVGGSSTYAFLDLVQSARVAGVGGYQSAVMDGDINLVLENPAILDSTMHKHLSTNFTNFYGGVNYGYLAYAHNFRKVGMLNFGIQYTNYGHFDQTDVGGNILGSFNANETAFNVSYARKLNKFFQVGLTGKVIYSQLAQYNSFGIAADLGILFHHPENNVSIGLVLKNAGGQLKPYTSGNYEPLPLNLQLAFSHRLKYVPLRINVTIKDLQKPNLNYDDPTNSGPDVDPLTGEPIEQTVGVGDAIMRHFVFSAEIYIAKVITASIGYNYGKRQELKVATKPGLAGFSWGLGIKVNRFEIGYARSIFHQAGGTNHISITTHLGKHLKRARTPRKKEKLPSPSSDG